MDVWIKIIFWFSIAGLIYTYGGYYILLRLLSIIRNRTIKQSENYFPMVSIIVAARNEEIVIEERIKNLLDIDYPAEKLEIIIGSDGSTDRTVEIASKYSEHGVVVFNFEENRGRARVHNDCVRKSRGEILVFTDAETSFDRSFLRKIVRNFFDERIGAVSGYLRYRSKSTGFEGAEGLFFKFELAMRSLEGTLGILFSGSGPCFALRKSLYADLKSYEDVDHTLPIEVIRRGYLVGLEHEALAYDYPTSSTIKGTLRARTRITSKASVSIARHLDLKFILKNPLTTWAIISRKFLRWFNGTLMIFALISNIWLINKGQLYFLTMLCQGVFYALFLVGGAALYFNKHLKIASWIFIFIMANIGMSLGLFKAMRGKIPSSYDNIRLKNI